MASASQVTRVNETRARITWSLRSTHVAAGQKIGYTVDSTNLKPLSAVLLQKQVGTTWEILARPKPDAKVSGTIAGDPMGRYYYRVIAMANHSAYLITKTLTVFSYATVGMDTLCAVVYKKCPTHTVDVNGKTFTYVFKATAPVGGYGHARTVLAFGGTSCRQLATRFAVVGKPVGSLGVVQPKLVDQYATIAGGTIGSLTVALDGYPWHLNIWGPGGQLIYVNGSASCWTSNGRD